MAKSTKEADKKLYVTGRLKRGKKHPPVTFWVPDALGDKIAALTEGPVAGTLAALAWIGLESLDGQRGSREFDLDFLNRLAEEAEKKAPEGRGRRV